MKPYPTNFKDLQLSSVPVGSLLRMENGKTLTVRQHEQSMSGIADKFLEGELAEHVEEYLVGLWFYNGRKFRAHYLWPTGMDIVAVVRRGPN